MFKKNLLFFGLLLFFWGVGCVNAALINHSYDKHDYLSNSNVTHFKLVIPEKKMPVILQNVESYNSVGLTIQNSGKLINKDNNKFIGNKKNGTIKIENFYFFITIFILLLILTDKLNFYKVIRSKIIISCFLLVPFSVFAVVDEDTTTTTWEFVQDNASAMWCKAEEANNELSSLTNATSGYYLYCIEVSCENGINVHKISEPISSRLKCANGNNNPSVIVSSSGAMDEQLRSGSSCSFNGAYVYATEKVFYDCSNNVDPSLDEVNVVNTNGLYVDGDETPIKKSGIWKIILTIGLVIGGIVYYLFRKYKKNNQVISDDDDI